MTRLGAGWSGIQILVGTRDFFLVKNVQTSSGACPTSVGARVLSRVNRPGYEVQALPSSAEVKNECSHMSAPTTYLHAVDRGNLTVVCLLLKSSPA